MPSAPVVRYLSLTGARRGSLMINLSSGCATTVIGQTVESVIGERYDGSF